MAEKNDLMGKVVYFSHPTFTFRTETEKECISRFHQLNVKKIINPANFGLRDDMKKKICEAEAIIGMCVSKKLTYLVWNEIEYGRANGSEIYTIMVESKNDIGPMVEGIPKDVCKLSLDESKRFSEDILKKEYRMNIYSMMIGNWGRRF